MYMSVMMPTAVSAISPLIVIGIGRLLWRCFFAAFAESMKAGQNQGPNLLNRGAARSP